MPSDFVLKTMNAAHRALLKVTGNRIGASFGGMRSLELTTVGRRSGQPRSVMLTAPLQEYKNYAGYQKKTEREIPLVVLRP